MVAAVLILLVIISLDIIFAETTKIGYKITNVFAKTFFNLSFDEEE